MHARTGGFLLAALGLALAAAGCDWTPGAVDEESLVVEAFIETGNPVPAVTLRETRPLGAGGEDRAAASGADVRLTVGDRLISYSERRPGRYTPVDGQFAVSGRAAWSLSVTWKGELATARGTTPPRIQIHEVCVDIPPEPSRAVQVDSLRRDSLDIPTDQGYLYPVDVSIRWAGQFPDIGSDSTLWVRAQLQPDAGSFPSEVVRFFLEPVDVRKEVQYQRSGDNRVWQGVYAVPVDEATDDLPRHALTATLVRGDSAFASFAQSRTDPERREPISNVDGALGVALGVAVDSLRFDSLATAGTETCSGPQ